MSLDEASAQQRALAWNWGDRRLVRCFLILSQARYHYADVRDYEAAAPHGPSEAHARSYWQDYNPERIPVDVTEVLADAALYFPDWRSFPQLELADLALWERDRLKP